MYAFKPLSMTPGTNYSSFSSTQPNDRKGQNESKRSTNSTPDTKQVRAPLHFATEERTASQNTVFTTTPLKSNFKSIPPKDFRLIPDTEYIENSECTPTSSIKNDDLKKHKTETITHLSNVQHMIKHWEKISLL